MNKDILYDSPIDNMIFFGSDQNNSYPKNSKANSKRYVTSCQNMTEASSGDINIINSYRTLPEKYTVYMVLYWKIQCPDVFLYLL